MAENTPSFTVTDRRKFTLEGDLRDATAATEQEPEQQQTTSAPPAQSSSPTAAATPAAGPRLVESAAAAAPAAPQPEAPRTDEDEAYADDIPEITAQDTAEQQAAYRQSSKDLDDMVAKANPGVKRPAPSEMNFDKLVQSIYMTAALQLGAGTQPGEQPRVDILGARQSIDMLNVLSEKTKGNLTEKEQRLLQNALFELRMTFLEITNAISSSAHTAPRPPGGAR